jgi:hypothetical protein
MVGMLLESDRLGSKWQGFPVGVGLRVDPGYHWGYIQHAKIRDDNSDSPGFDAGEYRKGKVLIKKVQNAIKRKR